MIVRQSVVAAAAVAALHLAASQESPRHRQSPEAQHSAAGFETDENYWKALDHRSFRSVPKILHVMYLDGRTMYEETCQEGTGLSCLPHNNCKRILVEEHKWTLQFWEYHSVEQMIKRHYLHLWDTFRLYDHLVKRADMARALVLHRYGGLYLDLDVDCYADPYPMLEGAMMVMQGSGFEGVTNAVMASAPRAPVWDTVFAVMLERAAHFPVHDPWKDGPIYMTGPQAVKEAMQDWLHLKHDDMVVFGYNGTKADQNGIRIHRLGTFFMPCWFQEEDCVKRVEDKVKAGKTGAAIAGPQVVGSHGFAGSWG